jgi:probable F420-dependent oxidoreductase
MSERAVTVVPAGEFVYGIQLPIQSQSRLYVSDWELVAGPEELIRLAKACDDAGFFYIANCDHVAIPASVAPRMGTFWTDTIATLGALSAHTQRVRLMSHVYVLPYRHPLMSAKSFATLDWLSGGRVIVGVGAGHVQEEFDALGVSFEDRGSILDDAIDILAAALADEFPEIDTPTWKVHGVGLAPRPVQQPRPPIWVGGSSKPALRRAAVRGDGWLPQGTPRAQMPEQIAFIREHRQKARGDDPIDLGAITESFYIGTPSWDVGGPPYVVSGAPQTIADCLLSFREMGVNHVQVRFRARSCDEAVDQITAFGADVAPLLR